MLSTRPSLRPFLIWLAFFYGTWLTIVLAGHHWQTIKEHYGIAIAMAFGSYVAGSTPMGGGTVGFPILVLLFKLPASLGRDFSFAVQSIGMTSATIFILSRRLPLEWVMLRWSLVGSLIGTPLGILFIAPHVPELAIKVLFAIVWASFGVLHLRRINDICANHGVAPAAHRFDRNAGLMIGLLAGATVASITGVGIDMVLYAVLVCLSRADLKVAIPSSVVIMSFTSVVGIATKALFTGVRTGRLRKLAGGGPRCRAWRAARSANREFNWAQTDAAICGRAVRGAVRMDDERRVFQPRLVRLAPVRGCGVALQRRI